MKGQSRSVLKSKKNENRKNLSHSIVFKAFKIAIDNFRQKLVQFLRIEMSSEMSSREQT
jgi:transcriptional regulator of met regulon